MAQLQRASEWDRHFPVGVLLEFGATTTLPSGSGIDATHSANNTSGLTSILNHPSQGLHAANLNHVLMYNAGPYFHETQQPLLATIESNTRGHYMWAAGQFTGKTTVDASTGIDAAFISNAGVANTRANADPIAQEVVNAIGSHPSLLMYILSDDTDSSQNATKAAKNNTMVRALQALDPYGRPASAMWRNRGYADLGADCRFIITYEYPCGRYANSTDTAEGDFHRSTFPSITGTATPDWVDVIRHRVALLPPGARHMWCLQAHFTATGTSSRLRLPTDREMRKQFWVAVGEGATGLYWFTYTDYTAGTPQPMIGARAASNAVAAELAGRLTPKIRSLLLDCTKSSDLFTTSGGGTSGLPVDYSSAYVSTLTHTTGTRYVVLCNNNTSTASVTVSSATLTGYLVSLETGTRYKIGTDAISLPALDGSIYEYDPDYGVPVQDVDLTTDVTTWWSTHWANPASSTYRSASAIKTNPVEVNVPVGGNLQSYVDIYGDNTTYVLPAGGVYGRVTMVEPQSVHFKSADANNKAICRGFAVYGSTHAQQYNSDMPGLNFGFVGKLYSGTDSSLTTGFPRSIRDIAKDRFITNPSSDLIWQDIAFVADPAQPVVYYKNYRIGTWQTDHWYEGAAIAMRCVKDVLVQGCTFSNYVWGSDNNLTGAISSVNNPQQNNTGAVAHPGLVWGNAGIRNVVIRNCTYTLATNTLNTGSPSACFFDGAQGMVAYNNTISGKQNQDTFNFLINDDYTGDIRQTGVITRSDLRMSRYVVIANNNVTPSGSTTLVSLSGEQLLVKSNTVNVGSGTIPSFAELSTKVCRLAATLKVKYDCYDFVLDSNAITANAVTSFVEWNVKVGYTPGLTSTDLYRSRVGRATITGNTVTRVNLAPGTVTRWQVEDAASITDGVTADGPMVISGNTPTTDLSGNGV